MRLLEYFGEPSTPCGNCDNCLNPPKALDATQVARKYLSAVFRNVRETRQDPNLFELPGGYRRVIVPLENVQQILESMSRFGAPR